MLNNSHIVKRGDTLAKIATAYETTPQELARINNITSMNYIKIGQSLTLPTASLSSSTPIATDNGTALDEAGKLFMRFVDSVRNAISDLEVYLAVGSEETTYKTDKNGEIPTVAIKKADTPVSVSVKKSAGGRKKISEFKTVNGNQYVLLTSPKVAVKSSMQRHEGEPPQNSQTTEKQKPNVTTYTRSAAGHPVLQVRIDEPPNEYNLKLGVNKEHKDRIIAASKRSGISVHAICGLINAEAALESSSLRNKNFGKWKCTSSNPKSSAQGLTQFITGTWIDQAVRPGKYLNTKATQNGWVTTGATPKGVIVQAFKLSDGKLILKTDHKFVSKIANKKNDANVSQLLKLRDDPECSIFAAVDYGVENLTGLRKKGYAIDGLNEGEKAKIFYLAHHLGLPDAGKFIENTMTEQRAKYLLELQNNKAFAANEAKKYGNSYLSAHRAWLAKYVDSRVVLNKFMFDTSKAPTVRGLIPLTESIRKPGKTAGQ